MNIHWQEQSLKRQRGKCLSIEEVTGFQALPGNGLTAILDGHTLYGGIIHLSAVRYPLMEISRRRQRNLPKQVRHHYSLEMKTVY